MSRSQAVAAALARGPRIAIARADADAVRATVALARQWENPVLALDYTRDTPRQHYSVAVPLDLPALRRARVGAARAGLDAAVGRLVFEREAVAYDADTAYTQALVAAARARLSGRAASDADSLVVLSVLRRDAGDASELDVQLATVTAGQLSNTATVDSMQATNALLAVQVAMGMPSSEPLIVLSDTLDLPASDTGASHGTTLLIAAAQSDARAAELALALERRRIFASPSLAVGFETHDPGGTGNRKLPTIGLAFPLPLFNQNDGAVQAATAQRDRAAATLTLARIELGAATARAERTLRVARERVTRGLRLVASAQRVVSMSLLAYQEGAAALPLVLEAQRTARETLFQVLDDIAAARNSAGLVRLLRLTANSSVP